jgi:hypothetical protein
LTYDYQLGRQKLCDKYALLAWPAKPFLQFDDDDEMASSRIVAYKTECVQAVY